MIIFLRRHLHTPVYRYCCIAALLLLMHSKSNAQNSDFIITPGTNVIVTGNNLVLQNTDVQADGLLQASNGNVIFSGSNASVIGGATIPLIQTFTLDKGASSVTLNSNVNVSGSVDFQSGLIELNNQTLSLVNNANLQNESEASRITGVNGGMVTTSATAVNNPSNLNIGTLGAVLTSAQNLGDVTLSRMHKPAVNPSNSNTGIQRTYLIQPTNNASLSATLRFYYFDAELNGKDENTLSLWSSTDGVTWLNAGVTNRNTTDNYVEYAGLDKLSYFTLTDASSVLPVNLVSFSVVCMGKYAEVNWKTASETNTENFIIQRSKDAVNWSDVGTVNAVNASNGNAYTYHDNNPQPATFYRLKINDKSGSFTYSPVFSGGCSEVTMPFTIYPNPAKDKAVATMSVREASKATIILYNISGKQMYNAVWNLQPGNNQYILPLQNLAAGTYIVKVLNNGATSVSKFIKQ